MPTGIFLQPNGTYHVFVRVEGKLRSKRYPADAKLVDMQRWRELQRSAAHFGVTLPPSDDRTFAADVANYLHDYKAIESFPERQHRMSQWVTAFGHLHRDQITDTMIRQQLERWKFTGHTNPKKRLSHASINLRRTDLMHFFTVMNGKSGYNPVRDVPPLPVQELVLTLPSYEDAERAIAAMAHPISPRKLGSKSQARLRVLLYTGWPSAVLKKLRKQDIDWKGRQAHLHGRKKGKGTKPITVPLSPLALKALKQFDKLDAYGPFDGNALRHRWHHGCDVAKIPRCRVYDLRHRFLTTVVTHSKDERGAAELGLHSDARMIRRYSRQAASERAQSALAAAFGPVTPVTVTVRSRGKKFDSRQARKAAR